MAVKRRRGRPTGTEINDKPLIMKVAGMLIDNPNLKPTTAFKRAYERWEPRDIRRFQIKWKRDGAQALALIRALRKNTSTASKEIARLKLAQTTERAHAAFRAAAGIDGVVSKFGDNPTVQIQRALDRLLSPWSFSESPVDRVLRQMQNDPAQRLIREMRRRDNWPPFT
jgi:hypothetical protein